MQNRTPGASGAAGPSATAGAAETSTAAAVTTTTAGVTTTAAGQVNPQENELRDEQRAEEGPEDEPWARRGECGDQNPGATGESNSYDTLSDTNFLTYANEGLTYVTL